MSYQQGSSSKADSIDCCQGALGTISLISSSCRVSKNCWLSGLGTSMSARDNWVRPWVTG